MPILDFVRENPDLAFVWVLLIYLLVGAALYPVLLVINAQPRPTNKEEGLLLTMLSACGWLPFMLGHIYHRVKGGGKPNTHTC